MRHLRHQIADGASAQHPLSIAFTEEAVAGLRRHGYPFAPLLKLVGVEGLRPSPTDAFYVAVQGKSREALRGHWQALQDQAVRLVGLLAGPASSQESAPDAPEPAVQVDRL